MASFVLEGVLGSLNFFLFERLDHTTQNVSGSEQRPTASGDMITRDGTPKELGIYKVNGSVDLPYTSVRQMNKRLAITRRAVVAPPWHPQRTTARLSHANPDIPENLNPIKHLLSHGHETLGDYCLAVPGGEPQPGAA